MKANDSAGESVADREVVVTRVFSVPAHLLFETFSKSEYVMKWFGPRGWPLTLCEMDFRKGGRYRFAMTGPSGKQGTPFGGTYLEIVPNRTIVYDDAFETSTAEKLVITVNFDEHDGETTLTIRTLFPSVVAKNKHLGAGYTQGLGSGLDQLADMVAELHREVKASGS